MSEPRCGFCARSRHFVRWLIAGPALAICDRCVGTASRVLRTTGAPHAMTRACSFCRAEVARSQYVAGDAAICDACLALCRGVIDEAVDAAAPAPLPTARVVRR